MLLLLLLLLLFRLVLVVALGLFAFYKTGGKILGLIVCFLKKTPMNTVNDVNKSQSESAIYSAKSLK